MDVLSLTQLLVILITVVSLAWIDKCASCFWVISAQSIQGPSCWTHPQSCDWEVWCMIYLESYPVFFWNKQDIFATARSIANLTGFLNRHRSKLFKRVEKLKLILACAKRFRLYSQSSFLSFLLYTQGRLSLLVCFAHIFFAGCVCDFGYITQI